jgi:hypothetical protein
MRTRKCECGHTWNDHEALFAGAGHSLRTIITCMHLTKRIKVVDGNDFVQYEVCACKEWRPEAKVSVPST